MENTKSKLEIVPFPKKYTLETDWWKECKIVGFDSQGNLKVDEESVNTIISSFDIKSPRQLNVAMVSITGNEGSGKSFYTNLVFEYLKSARNEDWLTPMIISPTSDYAKPLMGFPFGDQISGTGIQNEVSSGLYLIPQPFLLKLSTKPVCLLILHIINDGINENERNERQKKLEVLAHLVCSTIVEIIMESGKAFQVTSSLMNRFKMCPDIWVSACKNLAVLNRRVRKEGYSYDIPRDRPPDLEFDWKPVTNCRNHLHNNKGQLFSDGKVKSELNETVKWIVKNIMEIKPKMLSTGKEITYSDFCEFLREQVSTTNSIVEDSSYDDIKIEDIKSEEDFSNFAMSKSSIFDRDEYGQPETGISEYDLNPIATKTEMSRTKEINLKAETVQALPDSKNSMQLLDAIIHTVSVSDSSKISENPDINKKEEQRLTGLVEIVTTTVNERVETSFQNWLSNLTITNVTEFAQIFPDCFRDGLTKIYEAEHVPEDQKKHFEKECDQSLQDIRSSCDSIQAKIIHFQENIWFSNSVLLVKAIPAEIHSLFEDHNHVMSSRVSEALKKLAEPKLNEVLKCEEALFRECTEKVGQKSCEQLNPILSRFDLAKLNLNKVEEKLAELWIKKVDMIQQLLTLERSKNYNFKNELKPPLKVIILQNKTTHREVLTSQLEKLNKIYANIKREYDIKISEHLKSHPQGMEKELLSTANLQLRNELQVKIKESLLKAFGKDEPQEVHWKVLSLKMDRSWAAFEEQNNYILENKRPEPEKTVEAANSKQMSAPSTSKSEEKKKTRKKICTIL